MDGNSISDTAVNGGPGETEEANIVFPYLFEPGADTTHTLTFGYLNLCSGAGEDIQVEMAIDVAQIR